MNCIVLLFGKIGVLIWIVCLCMIMMLEVVGLFKNLCGEIMIVFFLMFVFGFMLIGRYGLDLV